MASSPKEIGSYQTAEGQTVHVYATPTGSVSGTAEEFAGKGATGTESLAYKSTQPTPEAPPSVPTPPSPAANTIQQQITVDKTQSYAAQVAEYEAKMAGTYGLVNIPGYQTVRALNIAQSARAIRDEKGRALDLTTAQRAAIALQPYFEKGKGNYGTAYRPALYYWSQGLKPPKIETVSERSQREQEMSRIMYAPDQPQKFIPAREVSPGLYEAPQLIIGDQQKISQNIEKAQSKFDFGSFFTLVPSAYAAGDETTTAVGRRATEKTTEYKLAKPEDILRAVEYATGTEEQKGTKVLGFDVYSLSGGLIGKPSVRATTEEEFKARKISTKVLPGTVKTPEGYTKVSVSGAELYPGEHNEIVINDLEEGFGKNYAKYIKNVSDFTQKGKDFFYKSATDLSKKGVFDIGLSSNIPYAKETSRLIGETLVQVPGDILGLIHTAGRLGQEKFNVSKLTPEEQMDVLFGTTIVASEFIKAGYPVAKGFLRKLGWESLKTEEEIAMRKLAERQAGKNILLNIPKTKITPEVIITGLEGASKTGKTAKLITSIAEGALIGAAEYSIATSENPRETAKQLASKSLAFGVLDVSTKSTFQPIKNYLLETRPIGNIEIVKVGAAEKELLKATKQGEKSIGKMIMRTEQQLRNRLGEKFVAKTDIYGITAQVEGKAAAELSTISKLDYLGKKGTRTLMEVPGRVSTISIITPKTNIAFEEATGRLPKEIYEVSTMGRASARIPQTKVKFTEQDIFSQYEMERMQKAFVKIGDIEAEQAALRMKGELYEGEIKTTTKKPQKSLLTFEEKFIKDIEKTLQNIRKKSEPVSEIYGKGKSETVRNIKKGIGKRKTAFAILQLKEINKPNIVMERLKRPLIGKKAQLALIREGTLTGFPESVTREQPKIEPKIIIETKPEVRIDKLTKELSRIQGLEGSRAMNRALLETRKIVLENFKPITRIKTIPITRTIPVSIGRTREMAMTKPKTEMALLTKEITGVITKPKTELQTKELQITTPKIQPIEITPPPTIIVPPPPIIIPPIMPPTIPSFKPRKEVMPSRPPTRTYVQDFTSKILGLKKLQVTPAQARAMIEKTYSGAEIRRAIEIVDKPFKTRRKKR